MSDLEYRAFMWAEMKPDLYGGESCDEVIPLWYAEVDGDMEGELSHAVALAAEKFPPGTKIIISQPVCPKCDQIQEVCVELGDCDFDWDGWRDNKYS